MSHFAQIDQNNIVTRVIVIDKKEIESGRWGDPKTWIQTSYNTRRGRHLSGGTPLRKNFAGVGYIYDPQRDAFYGKKPEGTWVLDEVTCTWVRPKAYPATPNDRNRYVWDEDTQDWRVNNTIEFHANTKPT